MQKIILISAALALIAAPIAGPDTAAAQELEDAVDGAIVGGVVGAVVGEKGNKGLLQLLWGEVQFCGLQHDDILIPIAFERRVDLIEFLF